MNEIFSAATDVVLLLQCGYLAWRLSALPTADPTARRAASAMYGGLAIGALLGAVVHGANANGALPLAAVWRGTLVFLCCAGGAALLLSERLVARPLGEEKADEEPARNQHNSLSTAGMGVAVLTGLAIVAAVVWPSFLVAAVSLGVGSLVLAASCARVGHRQRRPRLYLAVAGLALCLLGVAVQQLEWGVDPSWLDHNTVFHLIAIVGLALLYRGLRSGLDDRGRSGVSSC